MVVVLRLTPARTHLWCRAPKRLPLGTFTQAWRLRRGRPRGWAPMGFTHLCPGSTIPWRCMLSGGSAPCREGRSRSDRRAAARAHRPVRCHWRRSGGGRCRL